MFLSRGRGWQSHGSQNQGTMGNWGYKNGDCSQNSSMINLLVASLLTPSKKMCSNTLQNQLWKKYKTRQKGKVFEI